LETAWGLPWEVLSVMPLAKKLVSRWDWGKAYVTRWDRARGNLSVRERAPRKASRRANQTDSLKEPALAQRRESKLEEPNRWEGLTHLAGSSVQ
jgi:hypothetical protein